MKAIRVIRLKYRNRLFKAMASILPKRCKFEIWRRGKKTIEWIPVARYHDVGYCQEAKPLRLIDAIVFGVVTYNRDTFETIERVFRFNNTGWDPIEIREIRKGDILRKRLPSMTMGPAFKALTRSKIVKSEKNPKQRQWKVSVGAISPADKKRLLSFYN